MLSLDIPALTRLGSIHAARAAAVVLGAGAVETSRAAMFRPAGVHFKITPAGFTEAAAAAEVTVAEFQKEAVYWWTFSADHAENYTFEALPADGRQPTTAGAAAGPFAGHVYTTAGAHDAECLIFFREHVFSAHAQISVIERNWAHRIIGFCDPDGDPATGLPEGAGVSRAYTDAVDAFAALEAGTIDTLFFNRGKRYPLRGRSRYGEVNTLALTVGAGQVVDAVGTGARPVLYPAHDIGDAASVGGARTWRQYVASSAPDYAGEIAVEGQTQFQLIADIPKANTLVYVDGFRVDPDAYDVAGGALTFATGLAAGSRVVVLKTIVDSARSVDSLFFPLIRVLATTDADSDALIANIDLESGGYDAATPGEFKPGDLRTFEPGVQLDGFDILASGGKAFTNLTFFRCGATGFRNAFFAGIAAGSNIFIVDCTATNWADYGCYADKMHRTCLVGSSFRQKLDALNGPGQKTKNLIGMPNYADHGPYRNPFEYDAVINRCILESRSQWAGVSTVAAHAAQPSIRGIQWSYPGMSVCYSENYSMSAGSFLAAAPPNDTIPYPAHGLLYCGHNWHETTGSRAIETMAPIRSIGNVWAFLGTDYGGDILVFGAPNAEGVYTYDPKIDTSGVHSFHDTFIVEPSKPAASLLFTRQYTVNDGRLNQLRGSATAAGGETALTVTVTLHEYQYERGMYWRIWRSPDGSETLAASEATLTTQAAAYDVTPALPSDIGQTTATVTVALKSGTFAAGERIFITSEWTMETAGYVGQDGAPVMPVSTGETFLRNKAIAIVPEAALVNPLIAIQGDWSEFRIQESEAPLDPAAYRADRYAPISSLYQPLETSAARTAVATVASQTDRTGALRATPRSLGALQPEDDLSDQAPIPEIPVVSIAWSDPAPALGDSITPSSAGTLTITNAGSPALKADLSTHGYIDLARGVSTTQETAVTIQSGDRIRLAFDYAHPVGGRRIRWTSSRSFYDPAAFTPALLFTGGGVEGGFWDPSDLSTLWRDGGGTAPVTTDGQSVARIDDKSGNGRHWIAPVGEEPTYRTDGVKHWLEIDPASSDEFAVTVAEPSRGLPRAMIFAARNSASNTRLLGLWYAPSSDQNSRFSAALYDGKLYLDAHDVTPGDGRSVKAVTPPGPFVLLANCSADSRILRMNGKPEIDAGAFIDGAKPLVALDQMRIAASGSIPMQFVGALMIERALDPEEVALAEAWFAAKAGAAL